MSTSLAKMEHISECSSKISELDYILVASGSDNRAYEIISKLPPRCKTRVLVFNFNERLSVADELGTLFSYKSLPISNIQEISCSIKDPSSCLEQVESNDIKSTSNIGLDISCFTKPYFYFIIKLLNQKFGVENLKVFYTEPKRYLFNKGLFNTFHSSSGPLEIKEMSGFNGEEKRGAKRKLIVLLGFDGDLSKEINEDTSPSETVIVNGFPAFMPKFKDISLIINEKLVSDDVIKIHYAKANNPFDTYNLLQRIKNESTDDVFINIAPIGPKPMALGACLFALHYPEVRIIYPLPENYETKYSDSCWHSWQYDLPLKN